MPGLSSVASHPAMPVNLPLQHLPLQADKASEAAKPKVSEWRIGLKIVQDVAMASLKEFAIALTFAAITCTFVATPAGASLLIITALAVVALNTIIRAQGGVFTYLVHRIQDKKSLGYKFCSASLTVCNYLAPISFSVLDSTTRDVVIHEGGHALAASALYKNANPQITVMPLQGGVTSFWINGLTKVGKFFGEKGSRLIVAGAGPAAAVLADSIQIGVAHVIKKTHPTMSRYLKVTAIFSLFGHVMYALSALSTKQQMPGHDFVALWMGGIHPVASIVAMVALPLIVKLGLCAYDHIRAKQKEKTAVVAAAA